MTEILEKPLLIGFVGTVAAILVGFYWLRTGQKWFARLFVATVLGTIALLVAERLVVTDREAIRTTLDEIAACVQANDVAGAVAFVDPTSDKAAEVERELNRFRFKRAEVKKNLKVEMKTLSPPRVAKVSFNAAVEVEPYDGQTQGRVHLVVTMRDDDGQWRVLDYEAENALRGFQRGR